jgi:hypothetical protein
LEDLASALGFEDHIGTSTAGGYYARNGVISFGVVFLLFFMDAYS